MNIQVKLVKTVTGWFNIRNSETNELLLNAPYSTIQRLLPGFNETTTLGTAELNLKMIKELK